MNIVDLDKHKKTRLRVSVYAGAIFGVPTAALLFLLSLGGGFFGALFFGLLIGGFLFLLIFGIRELTHLAVNKKESKLNLSNPYIAVTFQREIGVLEITEGGFKYHSTTPGGNIKDFDIPLTESIEAEVGPAELKRLQKWMHYEIPVGFIRILDLPNQRGGYFQFFEIDGSIEKVKAEFEKIFEAYNKKLESK